MKTDKQIIAELFGRKPRARAKPHRCLECGTVTRYVFCAECHAKRRGQRETAE